MGGEGLHSVLAAISSRTQGATSFARISKKPVLGDLGKITHGASSFQVRLILCSPCRFGQVVGHAGNRDQGQGSHDAACEIVNPEWLFQQLVHDRCGTCHHSIRQEADSLPDHSQNSHRFTNPFRGCLLRNQVLQGNVGRHRGYIQGHADDWHHPDVGEEGQQCSRRDHDGRDRDQNFQQDHGTPSLGQETCKCKQWHHSQLWRQGCQYRNLLLLFQASMLQQTELIPEVQ
mmetsp:Transcript_37909/g.80271  ORF Transcript_37909/g.80271 Transcript_37909/m.80271 type:complete len:231 (+) Transcript_37909:426-1118(+)